MRQVSNLATQFEIDELEILIERKLEEITRHGQNLTKDEILKRIEYLKKLVFKRFNIRY